MSIAATFTVVAALLILGSASADQATKEVAFCPCSDTTKGSPSDDCQRPTQDTKHEDNTCKVIGPDASLDTWTCTKKSPVVQKIAACESVKSKYDCAPLEVKEGNTRCHPAGCKTTCYSGTGSALKLHCCSEKTPAKATVESASTTPTPATFTIGNGAQKNPTEAEKTRATVSTGTKVCQECPKCPTVAGDFDANEQYSCMPKNDATLLGAGAMVLFLAQFAINMVLLYLVLTK